MAGSQGRHDNVVARSGEGRLGLEEDDGDGRLVSAGLRVGGVLRTEAADGGDVVGREGREEAAHGEHSGRGGGREGVGVGRDDARGEAVAAGVGEAEVAVLLGLSVVDLGARW